MESKVVTPKKEVSKSSSKELSKGTPGQSQKGVDIHKQAAKHHLEASKHHLDAAKFHEVGEHEKAAMSTVKAQGSASLASDASREDAQMHSFNG